jgi:hypothetical protein
LGWRELIVVICLTRKEIYFEREAWTGQITLESLGKIDLRENAQRDANPSWRCAGRRQFPAASHERRTEKRLPETGRNAVPPSRCTNGWVNSRLARGVIAEVGDPPWIIRAAARHQV